MASHSTPVVGQKTSGQSNSFLVRFLPLAFVMGLGLSAMGAPLSTLPRNVHDTLGFGTITVGAMMGLESCVTLLTRGFAGRFSDQRGPKAGMLLGLSAAIASGLAYLVPLVLPVGPLTALAILALGRAAMGLAESLIFIAAETWPIAVLGAERTGQIVSWGGFAMFSGIAIGTGLGAWLAEQAGLIAVALLIAGLPLLGLAIALMQPAARLAAEPTRLTFLSALRTIWRANAGNALGTFGYAAANAFLALTFDARHWADGGLAVTLTGVGFVAARVIFANRMDAIIEAGAMPATLATEALGLVLVALAPVPWVALVGATITGLGYSMLYPQLAVPIIRRAPPGGVGVMMGAFTASYDFALLIAPPICGLIAQTAGYAAVFLTAGAAALLALWPTAAARTHARRPAPAC